MKNDPLTEKEVDEFLNYIHASIPVLEKDLERKKKELSDFRNKSDLSVEYTTEIEARTEKLCLRHNLINTWNKVLLSGLSFEKRQDPFVCQYVRLVNKIARTGETYA